VFFAVDKFMEWTAYGGAWTLSNVYAPEVTSLPSSPIDQQECIYVADATLGVKWHLRYRLASGSSYKWEMVGGADLLAEVAGGLVDTTLSTGGVFAAPAGGPTLTIPLAGDWLVTVGGNIAADGNTTDFYFSYAIGATAADVGDGTAGYSGTGGAAVRQDPQRTRRKTIAAAGTVLTFNWRSGGPARSYNRFLRARPVRVT
jgi:hypothetical protein